ncbi:glucose-inactivated glycerol proton symporter STL1 [Sugiyamaella lignohabitans]|uniref:Glucose-inactivated glycerol proton symporter STL1 n=1 Tax=Sugiyamaella lignohabitans TaxID=796027 RepID=A0A167CJ23_9ASCO|nr:glucose-inactivated glycerol proton symporter STL1 [Sugiyamaella lignohabitans]ANB11764.1 glucose-inactivated glycerol proton symporter STL1 [Sugiyamaella lignohabitans]
MMNGLQTLDLWQEYFNYPNPPTLGLLNAIISVGSTLAVPIAPFFADKIGRKWTVFIGSIVIFIGVTVQSASVNISMFIVARFLIGFGTAFARGAAPVLIAEIAHPQHRAVITTLYDCMYGIGGITAAWTNYGSLEIKSNWSWRLPSVLQAFPSVIQLAFLFWVSSQILIFNFIFANVNKVIRFQSHPVI